MTLRARVFVSAVICLAATAPGQLIAEGWRAYGSEMGTLFNLAAFSRENGTILQEQSSTNSHRIVGFTATGTQAWAYPLAPGNWGTSIRATTDNFAYVTTAGSNPPSIIALSQSGEFRWQYALAYNGYQFSFEDSRVYGNDLLVAGIGRVSGTTGRRTLLVSLNRFTGAVKYVREYTIDNVAYNSGGLIRSSQGFAYIFNRKDTGGTGILKIDPATGDPVATYAVIPFDVTSAEVDSAGQIYMAGNSNDAAGGQEVRKVNGAGTGNMPLVFRKTNGGYWVVLSKGFLYTLYFPGVRKMRLSDGATVWERLAGSGTSQYFSELKADAYGRLSAIRVDYPTQTTRLFLIDPSTGADIESISVSDTGESGFLSPMITNSYGETLVFGRVLTPMPNYPTRFAAHYFSPQEPVDDSYTVAQGNVLSTSGNGLLSNDRYTNPSACFVTKAPNSGPAQGSLALATTGEFSFDARTNGAAIPTGPQTFRYRSSRQGIVREGLVTINVTRGLTGFTFSRNSIAGVSSVSGTVTVSSAGGPAVVSIEDDSSFLSTPSSVTVAANKTMGTFIAQCSPVATTTVANVTARFESTAKVASLTIQPLTIAALKGPYVIQAPESGEMTVVLNGTTPTPVNVTIDNGNQYTTMPPTVTIPAGASSVTYTVTTTNPPRFWGGYIRAHGLGSYTTKLFVRPIP